MNLTFPTSLRGILAITCVLAGSACRSEPSAGSATADATPVGSGAERAPAQRGHGQPGPGPTSSSPAAPTSEPMRLESNDGAYLVIYRTRPAVIPVYEPFDIAVQVFDARRGHVALLDVQLAADAAMPEHRHGMNVVPQVLKNSDGTFTVTGMVFHMPGRWELYFDVTRNGVTERAQAEVFVD